MRRPAEKIAGQGTSGGGIDALTTPRCSPGAVASREDTSPPNECDAIADTLTLFYIDASPESTGISYHESPALSRRELRVSRDSAPIAAHATRFSLRPREGRDVYAAAASPSCHLARPAGQHGLPSLTAYIFIALKMPYLFELASGLCRLLMMRKYDAIDDYFDAFFWPR